MTAMTSRWLLAAVALSQLISPVVRSEVALTDVTASSKLDFTHHSGAAGAFVMPEIMGAGAALLDCDGDGDLDAYLIQGDGPNRLFRQREDGTFRDETERSRLGDPGYGMGVAVGDVDNDGDLDVYVTNHGPDRLYRNDGKCRYEDVTTQSGIQVDGWSSSATFLDYDRDGRLDLFVTRYVRHAADKRCTDAAGRRDYCSPSVFAAESDVLLRNEGEGKFRDVSRAARIDSPPAAGLGVVSFDANRDGWPDLYVANDGYANHLWINRKDGRFANEALLQGTALSLHGRAEAGMGVVAADLDGDLDLDLFLTHLDRETNTLYRFSEAQRGFEDASGPSGLGAASLGRTGFGVVALDLELDGDLDLAVTNGRVTRRGPTAQQITGDRPMLWFIEPNQLFVSGAGSARFDPASCDFTKPVLVSRGLAAGDVDNDGDVDLLVANIDERAQLYRNDSPRGAHWLTVRAMDRGRDALGATVTVVAGPSSQMRLVTTGGGYLSAHDPRAHFGLGDRTAVERVEIRWVDGQVESFEIGEVDRAVVLRRTANEVRQAR